MRQKSRSYRRSAGVFYWQENGTGKRGSLHTKDWPEPERLILAMNKVSKQPALNLAIGRAYLSAMATVAFRSSAATSRTAP